MKFETVLWYLAGIVAVALVSMHFFAKVCVDNTNGNTRGVPWFLPCGANETGVSSNPLSGSAGSTSVHTTSPADFSSVVSGSY